MESEGTEFLVSAGFLNTGFHIEEPTIHSMEQGEHLSDLNPLYAPPKDPAFLAGWSDLDHATVKSASPTHPRS
jgi:hypothetical protein